MNKKTLAVIAAAVFLGLVIFGAYGEFAKEDGSLSGSLEEVQIALETQSSDRSGVTIAVTPKNITANTASWNFEIVMDTHSVELDADLLEISELIADGTAYTPTSWEGDPPGGHHRSGILTFQSISSLLSVLELRIGDIKGESARSFLWAISEK